MKTVLRAFAMLMAICLTLGAFPAAKADKPLSFDYRSLKDGPYVWYDYQGWSGGEHKLSQGQTYVVEELVFQSMPYTYFSIPVPQLVVSHGVWGEAHPDRRYDELPLFRLLIMYYQNNPVEVEQCQFVLDGVKYTFDAKILMETMKDGTKIGGGVTIYLSKTSKQFFDAWRAAIHTGNYSIQLTLSGGGRSVHYPLKDYAQDFIFSVYDDFEKAGGCQDMFLDEGDIYMTGMTIESAQ